MYYYIKGKLAQKGENFVVVENGGIGFQVFTSLSSLGNVGEVGKEVTMYTHLYVREDIMDVYGFHTPEEKSMFLHLISVSGVGPKAALAILSVTTPAKFAIAVITNDIKTITKAAGVGPKLAQRVILELKDKLKNEDLEVEGNESSETNNHGEAISALVVLGYSAKEAGDIVRKIDPELEVEEIIKEALRGLIK